MKDEILAAAAKRAQGRGWWDDVPATQTKICDLLTCSQSTTNIFSSIFTARDNNSSLSLSLFSVFFQLSSFLPIFVRLRSGWIILLAWQNYFVSSVFKTQFFYLFPFLSWTIKWIFPSSPNLLFCTVSSLLFINVVFVSAHQPRSPPTTAACTFSSWPACMRCPRRGGTRTGSRPMRGAWNGIVKFR